MRRFDSTAYDLVHSLEDLLPTMNINNDVIQLHLYLLLISILRMKLRMY